MSYSILFYETFSYNQYFYNYLILKVLNEILYINHKIDLLFVRMFMIFLDIVARFNKYELFPNHNRNPIRKV